MAHGRRAVVRRLRSGDNVGEISIDRKEGRYQWGFGLNASQIYSWDMGTTFPFSLISIRNTVIMPLWRAPFYLEAGLFQDTQ